MALHIQLLTERLRYSTYLFFSRNLRKIDVLEATFFSANVLFCVSLTIEAF